MTSAINTKDLKILTDVGFVPFQGITKKPKRKIYRVTFTDTSYIEASANHVFFTEDLREIYLHDLEPGVVLLGTPNRVVDNIVCVGEEETYDIVGTNTHTYLANGILCHNCDFLSSDALLMSTLKIAEVTSIVSKMKPRFVINDVVFWYDIKLGGTYLVGVDPATGTGKDFTVITVYEFPNMRQVAEYRSNTMSPNDSYKVLKNILIFLEGKGTTVYFSVENNGVGEGIISLFEADENSPTNSEFVSEEGKGKRGFFTTARSKMKACVNFKEMFEKGNIHISSPILLAELKTFVRMRGSYDHLPGSTSDCIAATLVAIRLVEEIATYDQNAFDKLYSTNGFQQWDTSGVYDETNDTDAPMPFI